MVQEPFNPEGVTHATTEAALQRLVDEFGGQLYALGLHFCGDPTQAEDMVQEVFLQATHGWEGFKGRSSPKTWLYTIAARTCQRMHRKRAGEPDRIGSLDELLPFKEPLVAAIPGELDDVALLHVKKEARERLEAAIVSLPDEFRVPLILKEIVGFSVPEVAQILSVKDGTARSRVHRARLKLRAAIDISIPRNPKEAPPPAYDQQTCLDLLDAKQNALDRGVSFDAAVICERCRSVFASLNLTQEVCRELGQGSLPPGLRDRLRMAISSRVE